jgi:hypothetical protein
MERKKKWSPRYKPVCTRIKEKGRKERKGREKSVGGKSVGVVERDEKRVIAKAR